jgi:hypothetical protein
MRCPKCGYISFDHLVTCRKCNKSIGDAVGDLQGTAFDSAAPAFLQVADGTGRGERTGEAVRVGAAESFIQEEALETEGEALDEEIVLDDLAFDEPPEQEEIALVDDGPELRLSLGDTDELSLADDDETAPASPTPATARQLPTMDFGDLDISDLAPPALDGVVEPPEAEGEPAPVREPALAAAGVSSQAGASGLEDLQFNDLNLEGPDRLAAMETPARPAHPVRTGTALDTFQIDLGELFAENKK